MSEQKDAETFGVSSTQNFSFNHEQRGGRGRNTNFNQRGGGNGGDNFRGRGNGGDGFRGRGGYRKDQFVSAGKDPWTEDGHKDFFDTKKKTNNDAGKRAKNRFAGLDKIDKQKKLDNDDASNKSENA